MFTWFKKKTEETVVEPTPVEVKPELSVLDYPKSQYKVYWETLIVKQDEGQWVGEIRFIGWNGIDHRSTHSVSGTSAEQVQTLANKLIKEKMEDYKWH